VQQVIGDTTVEQNLALCLMVQGQRYFCSCGWANYIGFAGVPTAKLLAKQHAAECPRRHPTRVHVTEQPFWLRAYAAIS
jgi:hypothetical protein